MLPTPTQPTPTPLTQAQINAQNQAAYPGYPYPALVDPTPAQAEQDRYLTELLNTTASTVASVVKRMNESTRNDQETLDLILTELRGIQDGRASRLNQPSPNPSLKSVPTPTPGSVHVAPSTPAPITS